MWCCEIEKHKKQCFVWNVVVFVNLLVNIVFSFVIMHKTKCRTKHYDFLCIAFYQQNQSVLYEMWFCETEQQTTMFCMKCCRVVWIYM